MPPEQFMHGEVSPQSDLFGLGATLYEALTGMRPFPQGDETAIDKAQIYPQLVKRIRSHFTTSSMCRKPSSASS